jgi:FSR family fosmidomycin resistance protein-like MFS transporter
MANPLETRWIGERSRAIVRALPGKYRMSLATLVAKPAPHIRLIGVVSAAHFTSHIYILILAPLLPFVREAYGVSYTEIGFALAAFNIVSAALQTPAGFLVDWLGARTLLIAGLIVGALAYIVVGLVDSFWVMVAMFALAGVGNTVYHPADYSLLSHHVPTERIGQAYSIHTFAGLLGSAVTPASLLIMQNLWGWRGAFIGAGVFGLLVAAVMLMVREEPVVAATAKRGGGKDADANTQTAWQLLLSAPILLNMLFFVLIALMSGGMFNYSVVALGALYGTPVTIANGALSALLLLSAIGVLIGGLMVARTSRHGLLASLGLVGMAVPAALVASFDFGTVALVAVMTVFGFFFGFISPSRDMIVREVTPPGSFGKVFGFVTTGFNVGGIVSPVIFGAIMDAGHPRQVFLVVAASALAAILTVATVPRQAIKA